MTKDLLDRVMRIAIDKINSNYEYGQYGMVSDLYFVNAIADEQLKRQLLDKLMGDGRLITILDEIWGTENAYKLCLWIDNPNHPYYDMYRKGVHFNFDFLIDTQQEDGSWLPSWSWGEPDVWARVVKRIKGLLTVKFLAAMKTFALNQNE